MTDITVRQLQSSKIAWNSRKFHSTFIGTRESLWVSSQSGVDRYLPNIRMNSHTWSITKIHEAVGDIEGITSDGKGHVYYTTNKSILFQISIDQNDSEAIRIQGNSYSWFRGVVYDKNKDCVYVCDGARDVILKHTLGSSTFSEVSVTGSGKRAFFSLRGITLDHYGNLYVTDMHHVKKIDLLDQKVTTMAGSSVGYGTGSHRDGKVSDSKLHNPSTVCVAKDGTIYVLDLGNDFIRKIKNGIVSTFIASFVPSEMHLFRNGTLIICERNKSVLRIIKTDTSKSSYVTLDAPKYVDTKESHICFDGFGTLFLANGRTIYRIETSWKWTRFLWIGFLKEDATYCPLAGLPKDIILEIAYYVSPL